jgi:hypothetical protein
MSELHIARYGDAGQPIYEDEHGRTLEEISREETMQALEKSEIWAEFNEAFQADDELLSAAVGQLLGKDPTLDQFQNLLRSILKAGGQLTLKDSTGNRSKFSFTRREEEPVVEEPEAPKDKNGRPLSAAQIAWGEMAHWSETASSHQIQERRRTDPAFASFYAKNLEREVGATKVADGVENLNSRPKLNGVTPALLAFADEYRNTSSEKVRKFRRADTNPFGFQKYNEQYEAAIAAGLI